MTTLDGSSQSQATIHKDVQDDIIQADADLLCESFNENVIPWIIKYNFPTANPPKVWRKIKQKENFLEKAQMEEVVGRSAGLRQTKKYVTETYGGEWEEVTPVVGSATVNTPSFAEELETSEDSIQSITDIMSSDYIDTNPFGVFAENILNQYETLEELLYNWSEIETSIMDNPDLTVFASAFKEALTTSALNGSLNPSRNTGGGE